jgi:IS5 family transposase
MYFVQQWNGFSDEGVEDAITDSQALQKFVGIDLSREAAPDSTTVLQFRHLLEQHGLTKKLFDVGQRDAGRCGPDDARRHHRRRHDHRRPAIGQEQSECP